MAVNSPSTTAMASSASNCLPVMRSSTQEPASTAWPRSRGARIASFFWIESMVRHDEQRRLLFDLDMNLLKLRQQHGESPETTALTGVYHNLLRQWANT